MPTSFYYHNYCTIMCHIWGIGHPAHEIFASLSSLRSLITICNSLTLSSDLFLTSALPLLLPLTTRRLRYILMRLATSEGSQSSVGHTRRMTSALCTPHPTPSPHQFLRHHAPLFQTSRRQQLRLRPPRKSSASYFSTYASKRTAVA